jgi:hypothetical protein
MGIKALKSIEPESNKGTLEIDLSAFAGEGATVKFRQPKAADYFPDSADLLKLRTAYPEVAQNLLVNCIIIGRCYIPDVDDPQDAAFIKVLMDLSRQNTKAFYLIYWSFIGKYVEADMPEEIKTAKNESAV